MTSQVQYILLPQKEASYESRLKAVFKAANVAVPADLLDFARQNPDQMIFGDLTVQNEEEVTRLTQAARGRPGIVFAPKA